MCGRFVSATPPTVVAEHFGVTDIDASVGEEARPDYNVAPRRDVLVVRQRDDRTVLSRARWGFVPSWAKDPKVGDKMINARAETLASKAAYRSAFAKRRCLVPADGFYEWHTVGSTSAGRPVRQPVFVHRRDGGLLAFAGLWSVWKIPEGLDLAAAGLDSARPALDEWLRSCVIVTTAASPLVAPVHDRMPVMLPESAWEQWLDPDEHDATCLAPLLVSIPDSDLEMYPVSTRVNRPANNDADLLARVALDARPVEGAPTPRH